MKNKNKKETELSIQEFIKKTIDELSQVKNNGFELDSKIDFTISLVSSSNTKGGVDVRVFTVGASSEDEITHTVSFSYSNPAKLSQEIDNGVSAFGKGMGKMFDVIADKAEDMKRREELQLSQKSIVQNEKE